MLSFIRHELQTLSVPFIPYMKYISLLLLVFLLTYGFSHYGAPALPVWLPLQNELPIYCVDTNDRVVALTFDSAWGTEDLNEILSILARHKAPATFFVTGEWAEKYPEAIQAIDRAGHEIGNHGAHHKHMPLLSAAEMQDEIMDCHTIIRNLTGKDMHLFRAPYSDWNDLVVQTAHSLSYMSVNQSVDSLDWKDYGTDSIIRTVCEHKNLENGSIILLHNGSTYTKDALDPLLSRLEQQGYHFVKVSSLIYFSDYELDHTGKQFQKMKE